MKKVLTFLLALPLTAHAWQFEAGAGINAYQTVNGRWYQEGMPDNSLKATVPAFSLGLTGDIINHLAWHADYVYLGRASASCMCTPFDNYYSAAAHSYTGPASAPLVHYTGAGSSQGVALTLEPYTTWRGVRFASEVGAYVHRDTWNESVYNWTVGGPPQNIFLSAPTKIGVAPVVGASVGYGAFAIRYRHYFWPGTHQVPTLWQGANVVEAVYRW